MQKLTRWSVIIGAGVYSWYLVDFNGIISKWYMYNVGLGQLIHSYLSWGLYCPPHHVHIHTAPYYNAHVHTAPHIMCTYILPLHMMQDTIGQLVRHHSAVGGGALSGMMMLVAKPSLHNIPVTPEEFTGEEDSMDGVRYSTLHQGEDVEEPRGVRRILGSGLIF